MTRFTRTLLTTAAAALLTLALAAPALGHGPQPLPGAACNAGTGNAHGAILDHRGDSPAHEHIPHDHGFGCVHLNPTAAH